MLCPGLDSVSISIWSVWSQVCAPAARLALSSFMYHVPRLTETYFDDISLSLFYHNIINERIITSHPVSLTYNVFTTTECSYISLLCSAPSKHSFLLFCHHFLTILIFFKKITNRSFRFASPHLWNQHQLPVPLRHTIISLLHIHRISLTAVHVRHHHFYPP